jgi:hypothetical protein
MKPSEAVMETAGYLGLLRIIAAKKRRNLTITSRKLAWMTLKASKKAYSAGSIAL